LSRRSRRRRRIAQKDDLAVNALVRALLAFYRPCAHEAQCPPLELIRVRRGQPFGIRHAHRLAHDLERRRVAEGILQAFLHERDSKVRDVYADPCPAQGLRRRDRCPAPAERVKHRTALRA
jgi:hypothetical protein